LSELERSTGPDTAAVYIENPSYLGVIEDQVDAIAKIAHNAGPGS
jgi:glycine dehydrogenase subunit 1